MPENKLVKPGGSTVTVRQDVTDEITVGNEIASTAAAAAARAEIESRIVSARKYPRDVDQFRLDSLRESHRGSFAAISLYNRPVGNGKSAIDWSIRGVETFLQYFGNVHVASHIEWETADQVKLVVAVIDVQRNIGYSTDAVLDKLIERKEVKQGRTVRGRRENSYGDLVYLVEATKDEVRNLLGSERSKLIRDNGKRLLPRHILDECREAVDATLADENAKDPDSAKKKVMDKFAGLGISATMLKEYLGRPLETLSAKDLVDLTPLYNGLKEGDFTWVDVMRSKSEPAEGEAKAAASKSLKDRMMSQPKPEEPTPEAGK
jgi:hypothetical protein